MKMEVAAGKREPAGRHARLTCLRCDSGINGNEMSDFDRISHVGEPVLVPDAWIRPGAGRNGPELLGGR